MNVLISLHRGYGLGDAVQMSAVLRHIVKARPDWHIDYQAEEGRHQVGQGIVTNTFAYGTPYPSPHYDAEAQILLYDTWANWHDRPNTRVSSCLHERFGLGWEPSCGSYQVNVSDDIRRRSLSFLVPYARAGTHLERRHPDYNKPVKTRYVAVHYEGDSSPERKNLSHEQAARICTAIEKLGRIPLLLDWRNRSPLTRQLHLRSTGWSPSRIGWGGNAEMNCAIISQCQAFVGIDSGPGKCASATNTPTLITWTGHHPAPFHDPCPNTTHLVPTGYHGLEPVCNDSGVIDWFEKHYNIKQYTKDPVHEIENWLKEVLK